MKSGIILPSNVEELLKKKTVQDEQKEQEEFNTLFDLTEKWNKETCPKKKQELFNAIVSLLEKEST